MRVLVLGAAGMLGHKLLQRLRRDHEVAGTIRDPAVAMPKAPTAVVTATATYGDFKRFETSSSFTVK